METVATLPGRIQAEMAAAALRSAGIAATVVAEHTEAGAPPTGGSDVCVPSADAANAQVILASANRETPFTD